MTKITSFCALFFFMFSFSFAQDKIGNKIYAYGNPENTIKGKTLIAYQVDDPKSERKIIKEFTDQGIDAVSWNSFFIPGYQYSDAEMQQKVNEEEVQTLIIIKMTNSSTYTMSSSNTSYSSLTNSLNTLGTSGQVAGNVALLFEIYNVTDGFNKPEAVINANANNSWGMAGSQSGTTLKVVNRVLKALDDEGAIVK